MAEVLTLPGGRTLTYDDVGDPAGVPVVYLHGTPDSRLARHPDDQLAAAAGIRLLAVDRPGYGGTSPARSVPAPPPGAAMAGGMPTDRPGDATGRSCQATDRPDSPTGRPGDPTGRSGHRTGRPGDATDRPGDTTASGQPGDSTGRSGDAIGRSGAAAGGTTGQGFGADLVALLDRLEIDRAGLVAWSGGALDGLTAATDPGLAGRLTGLHLVGALVPREAYDDPEVREAGEHRLGLLELADSMPPEELAEAVAPLLAPWPCDRALALEHQRDQRDPSDQAVLAAIPGAVERLADALVEAVRHGLAGVQADLVAQAQPHGVDPGAIAVPVQLWYGTADTVTPPAFGRWYAQRIPHVDLHLVDGAGHYLPFTHWPRLLAALRHAADPG